MTDLSPEAWFCANGSKTDIPKLLTYSSVVSCESVCIAFILAGLNDVEVSACDISGAYLNAHVGEKAWFVMGAAGGSQQGIAMVITRALYGLKTSAKAWREFFACSLKDMGYRSCCADPDVWMKPEIIRLALLTGRICLYTSMIVSVYIMIQILSWKI